MDPMPTTDKIALLDVIELTEPFDGIPAGATGGVLELRHDDTALVEITSIPELDLERIDLPPALQASPYRHRTHAQRRSHLSPTPRPRRPRDPQR